ncbi:MAG: LamG domain-containing protein, partial [Parabacteroides sp.]|nr:LamG domain-containing protein [Parabacteroides sp.]
ITVFKNCGLSKESPYFVDSYIYIYIYIDKGFNFNTDFTIEMFFKLSTIYGYQTVVSGKENALQVRFKDGKLNFLNENVKELGESTQLAPINSWSHLAIVRYNNKINGYINGYLHLSVSSSYFYNNGYYCIGRQSQSNVEYLNKAYVDYYRISNIARYTSSFTPPIIK